MSALGPRAGGRSCWGPTSRRREAIDRTKMPFSSEDWVRRALEASWPANGRSFDRASLAALSLLAATAPSSFDAGGRALGGRRTVLQEVSYCGSDLDSRISRLVRQDEGGRRLTGASKAPTSGRTSARGVAGSHAFVLRPSEALACHLARRGLALREQLEGAADAGLDPYVSVLTRLPVADRRRAVCARRSPCAPTIPSRRLGAAPGPTNPPDDRGTRPSTSFGQPSNRARLKSSATTAGDQDVPLPRRASDAPVTGRQPPTLLALLLGQPAQPPSVPPFLRAFCIALRVVPPAGQMSSRRARVTRQTEVHRYAKSSPARRRSDRL